MRLVTAVVAAACLAGAVAASAAAVPAASAAIAGLPITHITPNPSAPGTATTFTVFCGRDAKSATLFGTTLGLADLNTMNSTPTAGTFAITLELPPNIAPGTYHPGVECSNGLTGNATLHVSPVPVRAPETGDGATATETGSVLEPIGYGLIAIGVLTGALALRRRTVPRN